MMRRWWLLLFALLPFMAVAQPSCIPGIYGVTLDVAAPKRYDAGWRLVWLCQKDNAPVFEYLACVHGTCVESTLRNAYINATQAADPTAAIKAAWTANVAGNCATAMGAFKTICDQTKADGQALLAAYAARSAAPAPEVWKVAVNSSYPTRPAYPFANGVRGTVSNGRAMVGAACDCTAKRVEGTSTYCGVNGVLTQVALCRK